MISQRAEIEIAWNGPYGWPKFGSNLPAVPQQSGVYLQSFEYREGYLIYAAGITRRSVRKRFGEHTRHYMNGEYNVLDIAAAQQGRRKEIWHGWGYARNHRAEFEQRKAAILDAVRNQLAGFRIFVADVGAEKRILERIEASVMNTLYQGPRPLCDVPDRGMMLMPRWDSEDPIVVINRCALKLYGLPRRLEV